jgi:hypothetical protein
LTISVTGIKLVITVNNMNELGEGQPQPLNLAQSIMMRKGALCQNQASRSFEPLSKEKIIRFVDIANDEKSSAATIITSVAGAISKNLPAIPTKIGFDYDLGQAVDRIFSPNDMTIAGGLLQQTVFENIDQIIEEMELVPIDADRFRDIYTVFMENIKNPGILKEVDPGERTEQHIPLITARALLVTLAGLQPLKKTPLKTRSKALTRRVPDHNRRIRAALYGPPRKQPVPA